MFYFYAAEGVAIILTVAAILNIRFLYQVVGQVGELRLQVDKLRNSQQAFENNADRALKEGFRQTKLELLTVQADLIRLKDSMSVPQKKTSSPSNRKPRTEEQKALASQKRKEWWDKKRQEQKKLTPDDLAVKLPSQTTQPV